MTDEQAPTTSPEPSGEEMIANAASQLKAEKPENDTGEEKVDTSDKNATQEPDGREYVDTDDPKVQARITHLYRQVKGSDERNRILESGVKRQQDIINKLVAKIDSFEQSQREKETRAAIDEIKRQKREARDVGDYDRVDDLDEQLDELRIEKKLVKPEKKAEPKEEEPKPHFENVDPAAKAEADKYTFEINRETGEYVRPWLHEGDPQYQKALKTAARLAQDYEAKGEMVELSTIVADLDRIMSGGKKKEPAHAEVMSGAGNLTNAKKQGTIKLTEDEKYVARKMGLSEKEYADMKLAEMKAS